MAVSKKKRKKNGTLAVLQRRIANAAEAVATNAALIRRDIVSRVFDPRRDYDKEAGYPKTITPDMYRKMWDRSGVAQRVVKFWPNESWSMDPNIYETEDPEETSWEMEVNDLQEKHNLFHFLERLDIMSGIGRYGVMLLGINDGKDFSEPVEGINERGEAIGSSADRELLYLQVFTEDSIRIPKREIDPTNPRYGMPVEYNIDVTEYGIEGQVLSETTLRVHWTRVIHVADNAEDSNIYGVPRQKPVWDRLLDYKKVSAGHAEMFWKGAFPGYSVETLPGPDGAEVDLDTDSIRDQFNDWANGLQRWLALTGVTIKSLAPQMADPGPHREAIMKDIAFSMGVPMRKLFGSEQAKLASEQDSRTWNVRVKRRQDKHVTPNIVREFFDRLIALGVLSEPTEGYTVEWPDLNTVTDEEKARVAKERTEALAKYVMSSVEQIIPPAEYLSMIHSLTPDEVEQIMLAAADFMLESDEVEEEEEEEVIPEDDSPNEDVRNVKLRKEEK